MLTNWTKTTLVEQVDFLTDLLSWYQLWFLRFERRIISYG
jgi:hypothetical protein